MKPLDFNHFVGPAKRVEDIDLPRIAHRIGCGEDHMHAFIDVETRGSGFDGKNRPKILFEPHIFHGLLRKHGTTAQLDAAVRAGLAYPKWGEKPYPNDSYPRLFAAMKINPALAIQSASWGLGQIMGFNHKLAGYASPEAMVRDFMLDEDNHLEAAVAFIENTGLAKHLRNIGTVQGARAFARGYNGPGYTEHDYHGRLMRAYQKWSRIKDTPWSPPDVPVKGSKPVTIEKVPGVLSLGSKGAAVEKWQQIINRLLTGDFVVVDGVYGDDTRRYTILVQEVLGLVPDGIAGPKTMLAAANEIKRRVLIREQEELDARMGVEKVAQQTDEQVEEALRDVGSETIKGADTIKEATFLERVLTFITLSGAAVISFVRENPWVVVTLVVLAFVCYVYLDRKKSGGVEQIVNARVKDTKTGQNVSRIDRILRAMGV